MVDLRVCGVHEGVREALVPHHEASAECDRIPDTLACVELRGL